MQHPILIIGGGIAGCSTARALAERGRKVLLLEREAEMATGASGNPLGVLYPQLTKVWTPLSRFSFMAYAHMQRQLSRWSREGKGDLFIQPGMIQLPRDENDLLKFERLHNILELSHDFVAPHTADQVREAMPHYAGADGLYFPHGAALNVRAACLYYLDHPNINVLYNAKVTVLSKKSDGWKVTLENGDSIEAEQVVSCNASDLLRFEQTAHLPLFWNRGQLSYLPADAVMHSLETIICHKGYIVPMNGGYLIGATYDRTYHKRDLRAEDHKENLAAVREQFPGWVKGEVQAVDLDGRASLRSVSKDRAPLVGQAVAEDGAPLGGLYVSAAHGSRGLLTAPLGAEYLANLITGVPFSGLSAEIEKTLSPRRFIK